MLKFTYGDSDIGLEYLAQSVEHLVLRRMALALRTGCRLLVEPCSASFLLPADLDQLPQLKNLIAQEPEEAIALSRADADYVEVSVNGVWICSNPETVEGIFAFSLSTPLEDLIVKLWKMAHIGVSVA